jgi:methionyl-tRNA formyltransferase
MNIVFMGTPRFAVNILDALNQSEHNILMVVTQPDKPVGRKKVLTPSAVKVYALEHNFRLFQPDVIKTDYQPIIDLKPDFIITAAYGQILPKALLEEIKAINVHGSLLPSYRGGAPIQYALFDGLKQTGVTIMYMAYQMDSGDIIKQGTCPILESDDFNTLSEKLSHIGAQLLLEVLKDIELGHINQTPQNSEEVTFAYTLKREDEYLDFWLPAEKVINKIRGLSPDVGAFTYLNDQMIKIYKAQKSDIIKHETPGTIVSLDKKLIIQTQQGCIEVLELLIPGKKKMLAKDFLNGQTIMRVGDVFKRKDV